MSLREDLRRAESSELIWVELGVDFNPEACLAEAKAVRDLYVEHGGDKDKGWKSLCLRGIRPTQTKGFKTYGYSSEEQVPYVWTEAADRCPRIADFVRSLPYSHFYRVRLMLLEAHGHISPHRDTDRKGLSAINIALNNPEGCVYTLDGYEIPFEAGRVIFLDVSHSHAVVNASSEDRYHVIVHGMPDQRRMQELVERSYRQKMA